MICLFVQLAARGVTKNEGCMNVHGMDGWRMLGEDGPQKNEGMVDVLVPLLVVWKMGICTK